MLFIDKVNFYNTIALSISWAVACYSFYFIEFYMKYVPVNNVYFLAVLMGISDMSCTALFKILIKWISAKNIISVSFLVLGMISLVVSILIWTVDLEEPYLTLFSVFIFGMRFFSGLCFNVSYYANNYHFSPLLRSGIFAITNITARLASILSPLVAEFVRNPSITVAISAFIASFTTKLL